jgi:phospholipid/cholesterol/gamma-HCH transport system substrate-binding protein
MVPSQKQLQWAQLRVGLTVIAAIFVLVILIFLMTGTTGLFTKKLTLYTYVDDASGLRTGASVRLQNVDIGNVVALRIVPDHPRTPVQITMSVSGKATSFLRKDSVAMLTTVGALGETYINIDSTSASRGPVQNGDTLAWRDVANLQDVVRSSQSTLQNVELLVRRVDRIVSAIETAQGSVGELIYDKALYSNLNRSVIQAQQILNEVNSGKGSLGRLIKNDDLYNKLNTSIDKVNQVADQVQSGQGSISKLLNDPSLYNNANRTISKANKLMEDIDSGKGTLGKLAHDQEFADRLQNVVNRLSNITDRLDRGEGSAGKLLRDPAVYDNTNKLLTDSQALIQAIRQNPKKYLTIKLKLF